MEKSLKKLYELDRRYDFSEFWTPNGKRLTKRRARRRTRRILNKETRK